MDKIKKGSLRASFGKYLLICFIACLAGDAVLYHVFDYLQRWYAAAYADMNIPEIFSPDDFQLWKRLPEDMWLYDLLHYGRLTAIPLWSVLCLWLTANRFYSDEIKKPVDTLAEASDRILGDDLDFEITSDCKNELGQLCGSFEEMRKNLYTSNYELWKSLEERKRLNSAFSHDLRTPVTVLKGYAELVKKFNGKLSPEKQADILMKMSVQAERLEHYTEKMSSVHKLEDIIPEEGEFTFAELCSQLEDVGKLLCGEISFNVEALGEADTVLHTDRELVMQVFENLAANAVRYTRSFVRCTAEVSGDKLRISVTDNGSGFSEEAIRRAWQPFYRDEKEDSEHFGLGLYICRLLCRKCGGELHIANSEDGGGAVTAEFFILMHQLTLEPDTCQK